MLSLLEPGQVRRQDCGAGTVTSGARTGEGQECVELMLSLLEPGQVRRQDCGAGTVTSGARTGEGQDCVELVLSLLEPGLVRDRTVWSWYCHCWSPDR